MWLSVGLRTTATDLRPLRGLKVVKRGQPRTGGTPEPPGKGGQSHALLVVAQVGAGLLHDGVALACREDRQAGGAGLDDAVDVGLAHAAAGAAVGALLDLVECETLAREGGDRGEGDIEADAAVDHGENKKWQRGKGAEWQSE